jgi:hypothetical protein
VRHVDGTEVLGLVGANDVAVFGKIDSEQHDLIFENVNAFKVVKWLSFFTKIAILNVDPGSFISEKELLKSVEESFNFLISGALHLSELLHEDGVEFLRWILPESQCEKDLLVSFSPLKFIWM